MLSIVVPVYNKKPYLERCINSILNQKYKDIELILVDDGSTDGSDMVCDRFADIDGRVIVIHQKNGGLINARQTGVREAKGDYVAFVDADDWIDNCMYERLMQIINNEKVDIVTSGFRYEGKVSDVIYDGLVEGKYDPGDMDVLEAIIWNYRSGSCGIMPSLATKVVKTELMKRIIYDVDTEITLGEDRAIFYPMVYMASNIYVLHESFYHYYVNEESMCYDNALSNYDKAKKYYDFMERIFNKNNMYCKLKHVIDRNFREILDIVERALFGNVECNYLFPFKDIPKGTKIIIYGLGVVGKSYCKYLMASEYAEIIAISDKYCDEKSFCGIEVIRPEHICHKNYDLILIANLRDEIADSICRELIKYGIDKSKIYWMRPHVV